MIPGVPYDAEIEYLESTGTQWIDTWVTPTINTGFNIKFYAKTSGSYIFGSGNNWNTNLFALLTATSAGDHHGAYLRIVNRYARSSTDARNRVVSASYFPNTYTVDGESYTIGSYSNVFIGPLTIFGLSGTTIVTGVRVFSFSLYDNGILIRDYIPVRVGQTGYMYDRVTKRLFGNKGTGSFVLGPDVAKPVIGLYGFKNMGSINYVRDELTAMWDGIENVGYNKHSSTTTTWVDLTGNGHSLTSSSPSWGVDHALATDNVLSRFSAPSTETGWFRSLVSNGTYTVEVTFIPGSWDPFLFVCRAEGGTNFFMRGSGLSAGTSGFYFRLDGGSITYNRRAGVAPLSAKTVAVSCDGRIGTMYLNGKYPVSILGNIAYDLPSDNSYGLGAPFNSNGTVYNNNKGNATNTKYFSVRIYSRALSPAEIAHNYQIDKARFNLP